MVSKPKLRIGLLLDSTQMTAWESRLVERLKASDYASIELVIENNSPGADTSKGRGFLRRLWDNRAMLLYSAYMRIDRRLFPVSPDAFETRDGTTLLEGIDHLHVVPEQTAFSDRLSPSDIEKIRSYDLDVLVRFGFRILRGDILKSAKHGVWSYHHGDNRVNRGGPAGVWEVLERWETTGSVLQVLTEDLDGGTVLYRSWSQTDVRSVNRNRNNFYWKTLSFIPRCLEQLHTLGASEFFARTQTCDELPTFYDRRLYLPSDFTNRRMLPLVAGVVMRYMRDRIVRTFYLDQWVLLYGRSKVGLSSFWRFKFILPPKERFYADPCLVERDGKVYAFIEDFVYARNKGHISVIEFDSKGKPSDTVTSVLERPYHLSYPHTFEHDGTYYMIPETMENRTIELYRCTDFPGKWELCKVLMQNVRAVDTTLHFQDGLWWMFVNIAENPGGSTLDELFLFYSDTLESDSWTPHPLNPIISDVRRSRPAGPIFRHGARLMRPSQDCGKRYGYGMRMNEITVLTRDAYEEVELDAIEPLWDKKLRATHSFTHAGGITMIDAVRRRRR